MHRTIPKSKTRPPAERSDGRFNSLCGIIYAISTTAMVSEKIETVLGIFLPFIPVLVVVFGPYQILIKILAGLIWLLAVIYILYALYYGRFSTRLLHDDNDDYIKSELEDYFSIVEDGLETDEIRVNLMIIETRFNIGVRRGGRGNKIFDRTVVTPANSTVIRRICICGDGEKEKRRLSGKIVWKIGEGCAGKAAEDAALIFYKDDESPHERDTYNMTLEQFDKTDHIAAVVSIPLYEADKLVADGEDLDSPMAIITVDTSSPDVAEDIKQALNNDNRREIFHPDLTTTHRGKKAQSYILNIAAALTAP